MTMPRAQASTPISVCPVAWLSNGTRVINPYKSVYTRTRIEQKHPLQFLFVGRSCVHQKTQYAASLDIRPQFAVCNGDWRPAVLHHVR
jgi:hypothetical protein